MELRVIFLDIDGVLNTSQDIKEKNNFEVMNPINVATLRHLVETMNAVLVISSSWRHGIDWEEHIRRVFSQSGWDCPPIIGRTIESSEGRGREIAIWVKEHEVTSFAIVDDYVFDMLPGQQKHLVHCNSELGFTSLNAQEVERCWTK